MNSQCLECGEFVSHLKAHQNTDKCRKIKDTNLICIYRCKKCNRDFEKLWHLQKHKCFGDKTDPKEIEDLKTKCKFYVKLLNTIGIPLDLDTEPYEPINLPQVRFYSPRETPEDDRQFPMKNEGKDDRKEDSISECSTLTPIIDSPSKNIYTVNPVLEQLHQDIGTSFISDMSRIKGLVLLLTQGKVESADGENRYYLLGNQLGEVVSRNYPKISEKTLLEELTNMKPFFKKVSNNMDARREFIGGMKDSFCGVDYIAYTLLFLEMYEPDLCLDITKIRESKIDSLSPMTIDQICSSYTFTYALSEIGYFVDTILIDQKLPRYAFCNDQYYRWEDNEWVLDPYMVDLTNALALRILEVCVPLFRGLYKYVFSDNNYRENWSKNSLMKGMGTQLYKNVEIAVPIFDLGHILRKHVSANNRPDIPDKQVLFEYRDEYQLMSTRIHSGIPGFDITSNIYDLMFDSFDPELPSKHLKKYIGGLSVYKNIYFPCYKFKEQVLGELQTYKNN